MTLLLFQCFKNSGSKLYAAGSALLPDFRNGKPASSLLTEISYKINFLPGIRHESIQCYNDRHLIFLQILYVLLQINNSRLQCREILC